MNRFTKFLGNLKSTVKSFKGTPEADSSSTFFKKIEAYNAESNNNTAFNNNVKVVNSIPQLDRILIIGHNKNRVISKIEEIVLRTRTADVPDHIQDACEIVHYHVMNDLPVRLVLVKMLVPDLDIKKNEVIDEQHYDEWLKYRNNMDHNESTIEVEDTYGMNVEGGRGKKSHDEWNVKREPENNSSWKKH
jgi:hypothetical protein